MKQVYNLKPIKVGLLLFSLMLNSFLISAQCDLSCFGSFNLSLDNNCTAAMTPMSVLNSNATDCSNGSLSVEVFDANDVLIPTSPVITGAYIGQTLKVVVTDAETGTYCMSSAFIEDKSPPQIICANDTISCTDEIPMAIPTDNCGTPDISFIEFEEQLDCSTGDHTFLITRLYTATDGQGMTATCIQQVYIEKPTAADIVFPPDFDGFDQPTLDCNAPNADPEITGSPTVNGLPIADACRLQAFSVDDTISICEGTIKIFREWKVASWCSSSFIAEATQFIKILDSTGPTINCPADTTFGTDFDVCSATISLPLPTATDDCSSTDSITFAVNWEFGNSFDPTPGVPLGDHIVTYIATDNCGNTSSCTMTITVEDDDPPNVTCEEFRTIGLNQDSTEFCAIELFDDGSNDNCTAVLDSFCIRRIDNPVFSDCIIFTCDDLGADPVMVEFKVCDEAGNCSFCTTEINVMDNLPPVINLCPSDTTLSCVEYPADMMVTGAPIAMDACRVADISFKDIEDLDNCNAGTVTRTFTITGMDGLTATCQQVITFTSGEDPVYTFPMDVHIECLAEATTDNTGVPTATDDCSNTFFTGFQDNVFETIENCQFTISRTFTIANNCDSSLTTGVQIITVEDNTAPVFDAANNSISYSCADEVVPFTPIAIDNCNSVVAVTLENSITTPGSCPDNFTRTETYIATDSCGNVSDPFVYTITVNDDIPPTADPLPPLGPFACIVDIPAENIAAVTGVMDNCNGPVTVSIIGTEVPVPCSDEIIRTYRITDRCGNFADLMQTITISDEIPPTADALVDLGPFSCSEDITPPNINEVTGEMDNCDGLVTVSFLSQTSGDNCDNTLIRTYRLMDQCGNTTDINQNILIDDTIAPTADQPAPLTNIDCFEDIPSAADLTNVSDNCIGSVDVTIDDSGLSNPGCSGILNRVYILTDICGNTSSLIQQIEINDQTAPTWEQMAGNLDINTDCAENVNLIPPTATDNCNNATVTISSDIVTDMTCDHRFIRTITYIATDGCLNESDPFIVTITVFDDEAPMANPLADAGPFDCIEDFPADITIVDGLTDNCNGSVTVSFISDTDAPLCMGTVVRTYEVSDVCGNTREITQNILIEDTSFPTADPLDDLGPFTCTDQIPAPDINLVINLQDNCGEVLTVSFLNDEALIRCSGSFLRTYQVSDQCGHTTNVTQTIIINDNIPPTMIDQTPSGSYDCASSIPDTILNFAPGVDNCGGEVTSELLIDDNSFRPLQCLDTLFQEFLLTDICGNDTIIVRQIIINDTVPPFFVDAVGSLDTVVQCATDPMNITIPTAMDACRFIDEVRVASVDTIFFECASRYTEQIGYVATDACGNQTLDTFFVQIMVDDTTLPAFTIFQRDTSTIDREPFPQPLICGEPFVFTTDATDNCGGEVTYRSQIIEADGSVIDLTGPTIDRSFNTGVNTVFFFAEDACGNEATDTFLVEVVDVTSPFYQCAGSPVFIDIVAGENVEFAPDFLVASRDDCSNTLPATFEGPSPNSIVLNCASLNGLSTRDTLVQIFLSDVFGNQSPFPCGVVLRLVNVDCPTIQMATVAGQLEDQAGNGVDEVVVEIAGPVISERVESTLGGSYFMPNLEMYQDYQIIPYRNNDILNGVSTMDLIMLGKHLLEISTLDSPYQLIAADINNDGNISNLDMIALRRALLIIDEEFQNNTSWRFVDSEFEFPNPANPFSSSFPESRFVHDLSSNEMVNDFMAIKIGDLNESANNSGLQQAGDTRSEETLILRTEDQLLEAGQVYKLSFSSDNFVNLEGFQFTIDFNPLAITPEFDNDFSAVLSNFTEENIGFTKLEEGLLSLSWHDVNSVTLANQASVFTLTFQAQVNTKLSNVLSFNNALIPAESYSVEFGTQKLALKYEGDLVDQNTETQFALLQNKPNPFRQQTVIPFILPEAGKARIEITDINGRMIVEHEAYYEAGYQEYTLDRSEINAGGVLFYHLQAGEFEATRKMVVIE